MKKWILLLVLLAVPMPVQAAPEWQRSIQVEWGYEPPTDLIATGFRLYQEGVEVCEWAVPTIRTGDCDVILTQKSTSFTLTATFSDGQESPHSDPYIFVDWGPKPRIIRLESR